MAAIAAQAVMQLRAATGAGMMECKKALQESGGDLESAREYLRKKGVAVAQKKAGRAAPEGAIAIAFAPDGQQAAMVRLACETDFVARNAQFQALLERLAQQVLAQGDTGVLAQKPVQGAEASMEEVLAAGISALGENLRLEECARMEGGPGGVLAGYVHTNARVGVLLCLEGPSPPPRPMHDLGHDLALHAAAMPVLAIDEDGLPAALLAKEREIAAAQFAESGKPEALKATVVEGRMRKFIQENTLLGQPFVKDPQASVRKLLQGASESLGAPLQVAQLVKYQV